MNIFASALALFCLSISAFITVTVFSWYNKQTRKRLTGRSLMMYKFVEENWDGTNGVDIRNISDFQRVFFPEQDLLIAALYDYAKKHDPDNCKHEWVDPNNPSESEKSIVVHASLLHSRNPTVVLTHSLIKMCTTSIRIIRLLIEGDVKSNYKITVHTTNMIESEHARMSVAIQQATAILVQNM